MQSKEYQEPHKQGGSSGGSKRVRLGIALLIAAFLSMQIPAFCDHPSAYKLYGQVDEVNYVCGAAGVSLVGNKLPSKVESVRQGSPAYYAGLEKDDQILSGSIGQNKLALIINRAGKTYSLSVDTGPVDLSRMQAKKDHDLKIPEVDVTQHKTPEVDVTQHKTPIPPPEDPPLKRLSQFDIVIVVDASGSMNQSLSSEPESKWQWCADHISSFAREIKPYLGGRGITLITFNNSFTKERGCSAERVENLFRTMTPAGATDMGSPLQDVLSEFLSTQRGRPLLVVVMTDGMPNRGPKVENVIIQATQEMRSPGEIKVTFLEIGEEYDGRALLKYLDDYLIHDGAKYDIVDTLTFDQLKQIGLAGAMVHAFEDKPTTAGVGSLQSELSQLKQQIEEAREAAAAKAAARAAKAAAKAKSANTVTAP